MTRPEYSGKRDLTYSKWHRTIGEECVATNLDYIEVRYGKIKAIIEEKDDRAMGVKNWQMRVFKEVASVLKVPLYIVFHNCAYTPQNGWKFRVIDINKKQTYFFTEEQHKKFLKNL